MDQWLRRWIVYQRERFPLAAHVPLVAAFSASAVCFSSLLRGHASLPSPAALVAAFMTSLLFFLQLRIADEFKDFEEDARYRPYRPVPRGLVTLRELAWLGAVAAAVQLAIAVILDASLVPLLIVTWTYLALMTREFFARQWLKAHPIAYMLSHMLILPLIDLYATACDWRVAGLSSPPAGLSWFLAVSFLNGLVVEIGRKTRAAADEEYGVDTYSALWGRNGAVWGWLFAVALTAGSAWQASVRIGTTAPTLVLLIVLATLCVVVAKRFLRTSRPGSGRWLEAMAGVWTVVMYLGLGAAPLAFAAWRGGR
jgi:4-hydroxybenzoate polyprenyltransferase